jgi:oxidase EvaA
MYEFYQNIRKSINTLDSKVFPLKEVKKVISNTQTNIQIIPNPLNNLNSWRFEEKTGNFAHVSGRFFSIQGMEFNGETFPVIVQPEVGILGMLCCSIDGVLHFLMQIKIEPGNGNGVQLSPTVQATKSNYSLVHGGELPNYLEFFLPNRNSITISDQYQSELGWRYYKKRNRNMIMLVNSIPAQDKLHIWLTLGQIRILANTPLLLNSCSRSVLSMLPRFSMNTYGVYTINEIFTRLIDYKESVKHQVKITSLSNVDGWSKGSGVFNSNLFKISLRGFNIQGGEREVRKWSQPLIKESNIGEFGLIIGTINKIPHVFWKLRHEPGLRDKVEFGPTWIKRSGYSDCDDILISAISKGETLENIKLAEEGGRFLQSNFFHRIILVGEVSSDFLGNEFIPMTAWQTQNFISMPTMVSSEARSLWYLCKEEWFD